MPADSVSIGELRWPVRVYRRDQVPGPGSDMGILETLEPLFACMAKIEPARPMTFYGSAQIETPVTHMIWIRYHWGLDTTHAILRTLQGPDRAVRHEVFRVRRILEMGGRQRFLMIEAEMEREGPNV
ncbi:phage head completion protein [Roseomonas elaeocarpi]|uniref:Head-tail adaptor protein n=1 Tax=Roseomonas elaeocarpi TaxID=907779 RepID=A0ABV6JQB2_9PROT